MPRRVNRSPLFEVQDLRDGHFCDHLTGLIHFDSTGEMLNGHLRYQITVDGKKFDVVTGYDAAKAVICAWLDMPNFFPRSVLDAYDRVRLAGRPAQRLHDRVPPGDDPLHQLRDASAPGEESRDR